MGLSYKNILVAVDGSESAHNAFKKAIQIAKANEAKLSLIHVIDTRSFGSIQSYEFDLTKQAEKYATDLLEEYKNKALSSGVKTVEPILEYGSPKAVITQEATKKINADLIVCGATGLNAVERFLIGSVSEHIARSAQCDVLIVKNDLEEE